MDEGMDLSMNARPRCAINTQAHSHKHTDRCSRVSACVHLADISLYL